MDKFLVFMESIRDDSNMEFVDTIVKGYAATHPEAVLEAKGDIRRYLMALGIAGGLMAGGNKLANMQTDAAVKETGREIAALTQAEKKGDMQTKDKILSKLRNPDARIVYKIEATPGGHRTFYTVFGVYDENGKLIEPSAM